MVASVAHDERSSDEHDADDHRGDSRPARPGDGAIDRTTVGADPPEPRRPRVSLADRIGRDQAEGAAAAEQVEGSAVEVRDQITVAV